MKTLQECKNIVAKKYGYTDFEDLYSDATTGVVMKYSDEAAEMYARIQIEKDRISESELMVIVKSESKNYDPSERTCFLEGAETVLRQLRNKPINLD